MDAIDPALQEQSLLQDSPLDDSKSNSKTPVVRGARACTVCRAAKMKCVGAEDGQQPCQRCKRTGVDCIFEKHRRGRKPGSKLSEASKMLRRLEKGLNNAKLKSQAHDVSPPTSAESSKYRLRPGEAYDSPPGQYSNELPPLNLPGEHRSEGRKPMEGALDEDDEDTEDEKDESMFPVNLIRRENRRHSFFKTILNPTEQEVPAPSYRNDRANSSASTYTSSSSNPNQLLDPVASGIIDEANAKVLFDLVFLRLNPFINLFDPALHSPEYIRSKSPFLYTTLLMAGCKFFKPESFKACQKLAHEFGVRAFAESWKSVEVCQAYACLMYWKEPEDTRTWTYIGYACRMAVELGLNRYVATPPPNETEFQLLERRNRERTYLVLFVHDRSLSTQTGRQWMLPEDDLVRHSNTWHEENGSMPIRPEDVIVAAFVNLRRIAAETTDVFYMHKGVPGATHMDVNKEVVLRNCNGKLTQWMDTWQHEMRRANGETFHMAFLSFFRLYVRLFLNSFGIQASMSPSSRTSPSLQALSACYTSAMENLQIVSNDFAQMSMLRYGQDSVTTMTAYSAVFLLKLLRSSKTLAELHEGATNEIHSAISKTADAYEEASHLSPACTGAAYHARFLRGLVAQDIFKARQTETTRYPSNSVSSEGRPHIRRHATSSASSSSNVASPPPPPYQSQQQMLQDESPFQFTASMSHMTGPQHEPMQVEPVPPPARVPISSTPATNIPYTNAYAAPQPQPQAHQPHQPHPHPPPQGPPGPHQQPLSDDMRYWNNMFRELGFGETVDSTTAAAAAVNYNAQGSGLAGFAGGRGPAQAAAATPATAPYPAQYAYHHMNSNAPGYGM